jgi:hypothetical protein
MKKLIYLIWKQNYKFIKMQNDDKVIQKKVHIYQAIFMISLILIYIILLFLLVNSFVYYENIVKAIK